MIWVITYIDKKDGHRYISHGVDKYDNIVMLPQERVDYVRYLGYDFEVGEYYLN